MSTMKKQSTLRAFGKVSKASAFPSFVKPTKEVLAPSNALCPPSKRKRDDSEDDEPATCDGNQLAFDKIFAKKPRYRPETPPPTPETSTVVAPSPSTAIKKLSLASVEADSTAHAVTYEDLPAPLRELIAIHENLLKALSIHFAHNGPSAPAETSTLCKTIQCLWKKRRVTIEDLQRVLALCELAVDDSAKISPTATIAHNKSPFKLTTASTATCLEYIGGAKKKVYRGGLTCNPFNVKCLQVLFKTDMMTLYLTAKNSSHLSFLHGSLSKYPLLKCDIGAQTEQRIAKASAARSDIMNVAKASQVRQNVKPVSNQAEEIPPEQASQQLKSRTLSLFERVKAKQLASAASNAPTAASILRQHAIGRISEVVEILRMKQQQKQPGGFGSTSDETLSKAKVSKVAFGFGQIIQEIKNSVAIPIQDDEAKMCLELLNRDIQGGWCTIFELGSVKSVVLQGDVKSGVDIRKELEKHEKGQGDESDIVGS